jgi:trk system potassium uptake protein TrkH
MNVKVVVYYIGVSLMMVAALMFVSGLIACFTPGDASRIPLLFSAFVTAVAGIFPLLFVRRGTERLRFREGNSVVVLSWVTVCLFGFLPYLLYGQEFSALDALFETVSGFTTTGASILDDVEGLPRGLQFWRISTAWVGGVGIVTLFSMFVTRIGDRSALSGAEISDVARSSFSGERNALFANRLLIVYVGLTLLTMFALKLTGLGWFDAAAHAMSACSTCGFSTRNASIAAFNNPAAEVVLTFSMLAAALNFGLIFLSFVRGGKKIWHSETVRVFLGLVALFIVVIAIDLYRSEGYDSAARALRDASFQVASLSTTTGFAMSDTVQWPALSMVLLWLCSWVCGCSGSTSGGIKMDRFLLAVKGIRSRIRSAVNPGQFWIVRVSGKVRSAEQVSEATNYIFCYVLIAAFFAVINVAGGLDFVTGLTASVACLGNVGPGFGDVGSMSNYAHIPAMLKVTGIVEMILGRLEIFPVLYLIGERFLKN